MNEFNVRVKIAFANKPTEQDVNDILEVNKIIHSTITMEERDEMALRN